MHSKAFGDDRGSGALEIALRSSARQGALRSFLNSLFILPRSSTNLDCQSASKIYPPNDTRRRRYRWILKRSSLIEYPVKQTEHQFFQGSRAASNLAGKSTGRPSQAKLPLGGGLAAQTARTINPRNHASLIAHYLGNRRFDQINTFSLLQKRRFKLAWLHAMRVNSSAGTRG
jgi:hypothetical protein